MACFDVCVCVNHPSWVFNEKDLGPLRATNQKRVKIFPISSREPFEKMIPIFET
jgi:hypothetical protein